MALIKERACTNIVEIVVCKSMQPIHATCESTLELDSVREARIDKEARGVVPSLSSGGGPASRRVRRAVRCWCCSAG
jgi:hypothetical protein